MPRKTTTPNGTTDVQPVRRASRTTAPKPLKYGRPVIDALIKMGEGIAMFFPAFREQPFNEAEHDWLVSDWYEFGLGNPLFQRLVLAMFSNSVYARLIASNVGVFGSRLVGYEQAKLQKVNAERRERGLGEVRHPLPIDEAAIVVNAAYVGRMAMQSQEDLIEQLSVEEGAADVESGSARDSGGQDGLGEDILSPLAAQAAGVRPDARNQR